MRNEKSRKKGKNGNKKIPPDPEKCNKKDDTWMNIIYLMQCKILECTNRMKRYQVHCGF